MIAAVQAGGKSRRMGRDKARLLVDGIPMIERVLAAGRQVADRLQIVVNSTQLEVDSYLELARVWGAESLTDLRPECGPLGGLETTLTTCRDRESALILACDLPYLSANFLSLLRARHDSSGAAITVPLDRGGRFQPLAAIYSGSCLPIVSEQLSQGRFRIDLLFDLVPTVRVFEEEYRHLAGSERFLLNFNTIEDFTSGKALRGEC